jgi:hypothetical protein
LGSMSLGLVTTHQLSALEKAEMQEAILRLSFEEPIQ